jgi:hypothetical protein
MGARSIDDRDRRDGALSRDLMGTLGVVLGSQGLAAAGVLALTVISGWLACSLVIVMLLLGLALVAAAGRRVPS